MHWIALPWPTTEQGAPATPEAVWWALHITPRVARCDEALLLEVSTTERLWGGRDAVVQRVLHAAGVDGAAGPWAEGETALVALALLRLRVQGLPAPGAVPDGLALALLTALRPCQAQLQSLGCRTWGDVRAMPRAGVARRWGAGVLRALDQAYGALAQPHDWLQWPEQFALTLELPCTATVAQELLRGVQPLLRALQHWLQARQQGVLALELAWTHDLRRLDGRPLPPGDRLQLRVARPAQDLAHVQRLLAEHLGRTVLQAPVPQVRLQVLESAPLPHANASLLPPEAWPPALVHAGVHAGGGGPTRGMPHPVQELLERLSARLGPQRVQAPVLHDDHRPEAMHGWVPAANVGRTRGQPVVPGRDVLWWPTWLLRPPQRLVCEGHRPCLHGPLRLLAGPHRLEAGWWSPWLDADGVDAHVAVRDYFMAYNPQAGLVWVYRLRVPPRLEALAPQGPAERTPLGVQWFLQGCYG